MQYLQEQIAALPYYLSLIGLGSEFERFPFGFLPLGESKLHDSFC